MLNIAQKWRKQATSHLCDTEIRFRVYINYPNAQVSDASIVFVRHVSFQLTPQLSNFKLLFVPYLFCIAYVMDKSCSFYNLIWKQTSKLNARVHN